MRWDALPPWVRVSVILLTYFVSSFVSVVVTNAIGPDILIALIYPGAALSIVLLLVFGMRYWPALFFNPYVGTLLNDLFGQPHLPLFSSALFWYAVIQVVGFGGACWLVQRLRLDARLVRSRDTILILLLTSFVGSLIVAVLTIGVFTLVVHPLSSLPHFKEEQHTAHTRCQACVADDAVFAYPKHRDACVYSSSL